MIDPSDRGFLLGDGVFETLMVLNGKAMFTQEHMARLHRALQAIELEVDPWFISDRIDRKLCAGEDGVLRVTISRGVGGRGLSSEDRSAPTIEAQLTPLDPARAFHPLHLVTSPLTRNPDAVTTRHKTLSYIDNVMALRSAVAAGADEALMLNTSGTVASAAAGNLWVLRGDRLITPPLDAGIVAGTVRAWLLEAAPLCGLQPAEEVLETGDLRSADFVFLTNSLRLMAPILSLDGDRLGAHMPGSFEALASSLCHALSEQSGRPLPFALDKLEDVSRL